MKTPRRTVKERMQNSYNAGFAMGHAAGEKAEHARHMTAQEQVEHTTAIKFINAVGQTMQQFADMLQPTGAIGKLLR